MSRAARGLCRIALAAVAVGGVRLAAQGTTPADTTARKPDTTSRAAAAPAPAASDTGGARPAAAVIPVADQPRGVDAEIRIALFELMNDRTVPALGRLEWLQASPVALSGAAGSEALRGREDLLFLLAESYYRLGMTDAFRATAQPLIAAGNGRYAPTLRGQLLVDAYRTGDYGRATSLAKNLGKTELRGLAALVAGLASYQLGAYADARASFAAARQTGAPYAAYAQYMDVLAQLRADTSQSQVGAALASLQTLAASAGGELGDQMRLTAAQLAYEAKQYDQAVTLANTVTTTGGFAAQALLTRAWALYKANQTATAAEAFAAFASRYPQLPERDESRLMAGQALLQDGRTDDAARLFRLVADSAGAEVRSMQARTAGAMNEAARALVQARASGLLFVNDPASGKTIAVQDVAGADPAVVAAAVADSAGLALPEPGAPELVSLSGMTSRLNAVGGPLAGEFPQRVLFTPGVPARRAEYSRRSQALVAADAAVAVARYRLEERLAMRSAQLEMLNAMRQLAKDENANLLALSARLNAVRDSLAQMVVAINTATARIRQLFQVQFASTRRLAAENAASIDSIRRDVSAGLTPPDTEMLALEAQTADSYRQTADIIERGLDQALSHHPVFALRDSVRVRGDRVRALLAETQGVIANTDRLIAAELARVQATDPATAERAALAAAGARRTSAEGLLLAFVDRELNARAASLVGQLRHDIEAAEFGVASAAFFQTLDAQAAPGPPTGTNQPSGGSASNVPASTPPPPPPPLQ